MKYQNNDVFINLDPDFTLISGSYTIQSYSITSGQDPDGHIYAGLVTSFGSNGKMTFSIGRSKSETVANWFNQRVLPSQNTFGHTADELNFAFIGTLQLTVTGGLYGTAHETLTFNDIALAQGSSGSNENWWFGGQYCSNIGNDQVTADGVNSKGIKAVSVFLRGDGNGDSVITATPQVVNTANWMGRLDNSVRLDGIMMPGSHDAGMSELHHCNPAVGADGYTRTQSANVGQQLADGSRYFDIRVDYDHDVLVTYHRTGAFGCNGQPLADVLDETTAFLTQHPTETAILKFSHIRDDNGHDPSFTKQKINEMLDSYSTFMYTNSLNGVNLATVTLGSVRGKMILVFDYDQYINPATGRFRYKDGSSAQPGANITVYDNYSETDDYNTMKNDQLQKWNEYARLNAGHLFLLSWTLTSTPPDPSIQTLAGEANSRLPDVLHDQIVVNKAPLPNIVYIDFMDNTVAASIIQYNF